MKPKSPIRQYSMESSGSTSLSDLQSSFDTTRAMAFSDPPMSTESQFGRELHKTVSITGLVREELLEILKGFTIGDQFVRQGEIENIVERCLKKKFVVISSEQNENTPAINEATELTSTSTTEEAIEVVVRQKSEKDDRDCLILENFHILETRLTALEKKVSALSPTEPTRRPSVRLNRCGIKTECRSFLCKMQARASKAHNHKTDMSKKIHQPESDKKSHRKEAERKAYKAEKAARAHKLESEQKAQEAETYGKPYKAETTTKVHHNAEPTTERRTTETANQSTRMKVTTKINNRGVKIDALGRKTSIPVVNPKFLEDSSKEVKLIEKPAGNGRARVTSTGEYEYPDEEPVIPPTYDKYKMMVLMQRQYDINMSTYPKSSTTLLLNKARNRYPWDD